MPNRYAIRASVVPPEGGGAEITELWIGQEGLDMLRMICHGMDIEGIPGPQGAQGPPGDASSAWPVGSVFMAVVATNPAELLGFGTWQAIGAGRVLVGLNAADPDFDTLEETGGAKTHALTVNEIPSHTHTQDAHSHGLSNLRGGGTGSATTTVSGAAEGPDTSSTPTSLVTDAVVATNQNTGGGAAHNNLQPYLVVNIWKRTA